MLDRLEGRETCDLVDDVAQPVVSRVIGSFMGIPEEDDAIWARLMNSVLGAGDPDLNPDGVEGAVDKDIPEIFERCRELIAERRENPTDDLTSVLVNAEVDGEKLEEHEIVMGFFLLVAAGNDSHEGDLLQRDARADGRPRPEAAAARRPSLVPDAVEEALRMFPAFAHFRRTATRDTELHGQKIKEGEKVVMWYVSSNRDETRYEDADRFDLSRKPEHQAFGAGGRHFCLGTALARLELRILIEETLKRYPRDRARRRARATESLFVNQLKSLPVRAQPLTAGRRMRRSGARGCRRRIGPAAGRQEHVAPQRPRARSSPAQATPCSSSVASIAAPKRPCSRSAAARSSVMSRRSRASVPLSPARAGDACEELARRSRCSNAYAKPASFAGVSGWAAKRRSSSAPSRRAASFNSDGEEPSAPSRSSTRPTWSSVSARWCSMASLSSAGSAGVTERFWSSLAWISIAWASAR